MQWTQQRRDYLAIIQWSGEVGMTEGGHTGVQPRREQGVGTYWGTTPARAGRGEVLGYNPGASGRSGDAPGYNPGASGERGRTGVQPQREREELQSGVSFDLVCAGG